MQILPLATLPLRMNNMGEDANIGMIKLHSEAEQQRWRQIAESFRQSPYYLPEMEQQEEKPLPVAGYMGSYGNKHVIGLTGEGELSVGDMLYLHPPKTKATVYLTTEEIVGLWNDENLKWPIRIVDFARAIEQEVLRRNK